MKRCVPEEYRWARDSCVFVAVHRQQVSVRIVRTRRCACAGNGNVAPVVTFERGTRARRARTMRIIAGRPSSPKLFIIIPRYFGRLDAASGTRTRYNRIVIQSDSVNIFTARSRTLLTRICSRHTTTEINLFKIII